jgi:hypothetical protein
MKSIHDTPGLYTSERDFKRVYKATSVSKKSETTAATTLRGPIPPPLMLTFDSISNTPVVDPYSVSQWNTFFDLPTNGTPFSEIIINDNSVYFFGGSGITLKDWLFSDSNHSHLISVIDNGSCISYVGYCSFAASTQAWAEVPTILTTVDLPGVITIGDGAFYLCYSLSSVNLPKMTRAGAWSFTGIISAPSLSFPSCTYMDWGCIAMTDTDWNPLPNVLTSLYLPVLETAEETCFACLTELTELNLPELKTGGKSWIFFNDGHSWNPIPHKLTTVNAPKLETTGIRSFYNWTGLTSVDFPLLTTIGEESFYGCISLNSFNLPSLSSIGYGCFQRCRSLGSIPSGLFDNCVSSTDFSHMFDSCTALTSIPTDLFRYNTGVTSFHYTFYNSSVTSIPTDLFKYNTEVTDFSGIFTRCRSLGAIPSADLFRYNTKATNMSSIFSSCTGITSIPTGLFNYNTGVTNLSSCFYENGITSIPNDLFRYNTLLTDLYGVFDYCQISSIPSDLFQYNTQLTNLGGVFAHNTALGAISADLFRYNTGVTSFDNTFGLSSLPSIPANLFRYNTKVTTFNGTFGQTPITSIPVDTFRYNTLVMLFSGTFSYCTSLTSIPSGIFTYNTAAQYFITTFQQCTALTGNAPTLWISFPSALGIMCFNGDTGLTNYASIPADWK